MGFGISKYYEEFSQNIKQKISHLPFEKYVFLIADGMQQKYNGKINKMLVERIKRNLSQIPNSNMLSSEIFEKKIPLAMVKKKYYENIDFYNEVNNLVQKNRRVSDIKKVELLAGYVIEEIALIIYFNKKGFTKIGPAEKEDAFDCLAQKYFDVNNFIYI